MPKIKPLTKVEILQAMSKTKSVRSAARYLGCSYQHLKKWMKYYKDEKTGISLFDSHKNPHGHGISKFLTNKKKAPALLDIIEGRADPSNFDINKIKARLFQECYLREECYRCGFTERRIIDSKIPLILHFKNNNKKHYAIKNLEPLCYNCYFLYIEDIFTKADKQHMEDYLPASNVTKKTEFELDPYHLKRLKELGLMDDEEDDFSDLISKI
jgi:hypothetical protein